MIVNLVGYEPPPRGTPFTTAIIEASPSSTGPWTTVQAVNLDPVDADPQNPAVREFHFDDPTGTETSWYRVSFKDALDITTEPSTPVTPYFRITYLPTVKQIGSLLRARTKTDAGELGTFTSATRPTSADVRDLIRQSSNLIATSVGREVSPALQEAARGVVTLLTACLVELSYFPEQVATNRSAYTQYNDMYEAQLKNLVEGQKEAAVGDQVDPGEGSGYPSGGGFGDDWCEDYGGAPSYTSMTRPM